MARVQTIAERQPVAYDDDDEEEYDPGEALQPSVKPVDTVHPDFEAPEVVLGPYIVPQPPALSEHDTLQCKLCNVSFTLQY